MTSLMPAGTLSAGSLTDSIGGADQGVSPPQAVDAHAEQTPDNAPPEQTPGDPNAPPPDEVTSDPSGTDAGCQCECNCLLLMPFTGAAIPVPVGTDTSDVPGDVSLVNGQLPTGFDPSLDVIRPPLSFAPETVLVVDSVGPREPTGLVDAAVRVAQTWYSALGEPPQVVSVEGGDEPWPVLAEVGTTSPSFRKVGRTVFAARGMNAGAGLGVAVPPGSSPAASGQVAGPPIGPDAGGGGPSRGSGGGGSGGGGSGGGGSGGGGSGGGGSGGGGSGGGGSGGGGSGGGGSGGGGGAGGGFGPWEQYGALAGQAAAGAQAPASGPGPAQPSGTKRVMSPSPGAAPARPGPAGPGGQFRSPPGGAAFSSTPAAGVWTDPSRSFGNAPAAGAATLTPIGLGGLGGKAPNDSGSAQSPGAAGDQSRGIPPIVRAGGSAHTGSPAGGSPSVAGNATDVFGRPRSASAIEDKMEDVRKQQIDVEARRLAEEERHEKAEKAAGRKLPESDRSKGLHAQVTSLADEWGRLTRLRDSENDRKENRRRAPGYRSQQRARATDESRRSANSLDKWAKHHKKSNDPRLPPSEQAREGRKADQDLNRGLDQAVRADEAQENSGRLTPAFGVSPFDSDAVVAAGRAIVALSAIESSESRIDSAIAAADKAANVGDLKKAGGRLVAEREKVGYQERQALVQMGKAEAAAKNDPKNPTKQKAAEVARYAYEEAKKKAAELRKKIDIALDEVIRKLINRTMIAGLSAAPPPGGAQNFVLAAPFGEMPPGSAGPATATPPSSLVDVGGSSTTGDETGGSGEDDDGGQSHGVNDPCASCNCDPPCEPPAKCVCTPPIGDDSDEWKEPEFETEDVQKGKHGFTPDKGRGVAQSPEIPEHPEGSPEIPEQPSGRERPVLVRIEGLPPVGPDGGPVGQQDLFSDKRFRKVNKFIENWYRNLKEQAKGLYDTRKRSNHPAQKTAMRTLQWLIRETRLLEASAKTATTTKKQGDLLHRTDTLTAMLALIASINQSVELPNLAPWGLDKPVRRMLDEQRAAVLRFLNKLSEAYLAKKFGYVDTLEGKIGLENARILRAVTNEWKPDRLSFELTEWIEAAWGVLGDASDDASRLFWKLYYDFFGTVEEMLEAIPQIPDHVLEDINRAWKDGDKKAALRVVLFVAAVYKALKLRKKAGEVTPKRPTRKALQKRDGKPLRNAGRPTIDDNKFTHYALNEKSPNPKASSKARRYRERLGFTLDNWRELRAKIIEAIQTTPAKLGESTKYGDKFIVDVRITGPNGKTGLVETVWQYDVGSSRPRLITHRTLKE